MNISQIDQVQYSEYLEIYKKTLKSVFYEKNNIDDFSQHRGFPIEVWNGIMSTKPLSVSIPKQYGGRGAIVKECLGLLAASSYESLPLSLTFGINIALFLEPVAKYGQETLKQGIFDRFLHQQNMGGLMITEPDYGSDALNMQTYNQRIGEHYHIKGTKHWQGLTGIADYWLMTCRNKSEKGDLNRDVDFFICDAHDPAQHIEVTELYNNIGLYGIPYGKNLVDIKVPDTHKLIPESTGLKLMMDLLHRSRLQFPGMAMGFIERMLDDAIDHTRKRFVGGKALIQLDQVKYQIARIQSAFTICSGMCSRSSEFSSIENNMAGHGLEANAMKAYVTDLMQESAQRLAQLKGANGYKAESFAARGIVDSRPFQIFEGSNEMLYTQIAEMVLKQMGRKKIAKLSDYLSDLHCTTKATSRYKSLIDFEPGTNLPQRKLVDLGRIISRIISGQFVLNLAEKGFSPDLVRDSLQMIEHEISFWIGSFNGHVTVEPIEDYKEKASWLAY